MQDFRLTMKMAHAVSRMISEGVRFDQITVLTLRIWKDRSEQTV